MKIMREQELSSNVAGLGTAGREAGGAPPKAELDLAFLELQVLSDPELEQEVLTLFLNQARDVLARMGLEDEAQRSNSAHLLKGSARGIGAFAAADAAATFERTPTGERAAAFQSMTDAFLRATQAIENRLAQLAAEARAR